MATHPALLVVAVVFGLVGTYDTVAVLAGVDPELVMLWITGWILLLPYALLRWGSGGRSSSAW